VVAQSEAEVFAAVASSITSLLSRATTDYLTRQELAVLNHIKRMMVEARLDLRDYTYADSRAEMDKNAKAALKHLAVLRKDILAASEFGAFGPADVAHLTAQIDQVTELVQK
jgi:hypothetical protein